MGAEADVRAESAGHSQSSEAEPDLAAGAAVDGRSPLWEVTPIADWKTCAPLLRDCNYGGSFCELLVVEAIQEYLNFHGLQETQKALLQVQSRVALENAFGMVSDPDDSHCQGANSDVQAELAVVNALHDFDEGLREPFLQRWKVLVPSTSPTGGSLELRLRVYFGTYKTRKALFANDPETPLLEPDFSDLKAFLSSRPAAVGMESTHSLSSLYALPFVPQPHQNSALRFIFEEPWAQQLRSDVKAFLTAYTSTRHAPFFRHLAGWMIMSRCPAGNSPPFTSWQELLRLADTSLNASTHAAKLQTFGSPPQSLEPGHDSHERSEELLNWLGVGGKLLPEMRKQVADLRRRLGAVARRPADEAPSVQELISDDVFIFNPLNSRLRFEETPSMRPSIQSLVRAQSVDWEPQGVSTPVPVLQDRLWPREALRGSSASSLNASNSNAGAVRRLHSARSIESRARTATALLPVPPALDFGRIAGVLNGEDAGGTPPILSVLRAEGIAAYGRSQRWQHALTLFYDLSESKIGFRLDAVVLSALVSTLERGLRWSFTLQLLRPSAPVTGTPTPRGLTSSAAACAKQSEWTWALRLHTSGQPSVQSLTVSVTACETASRWSLALELSKQSINSRVQVDFMAMNSILNVCAGARQWQSCLEMAGASTKEKDPVMSNIISNACAGPWAWMKGMASLEDASHHINRGLFPSLLAGFSAVMQSLPWPTAVDVLKDLRRCDVELDTMAFSSFLKTLELDGNWRYSLQSLQENDQKQLPPDGLLYNALVSSCEKSSDWKAAVSLFTFRLGDFGLDSTSISATVLSCCQSNQWQLALELLHWTSMARCPPTSHASATLISAVEDIPDVEVRVLLMLAHATVDGVAPPSYLLGTLRSALLAAATYRHPLVAKPSFSPGLSAIGSQGLYRYSKELQLLRVRCRAKFPETVVEGRWNTES
eukprot:symbB.v1.2.027016.t1/scaffold2744.1/size71806/2